MKIAIIGHKRIPSNEGGIEKGVEQHSVRMAALGHEVHVYNRGGHNVYGKKYDNKKLKEYKGVRIITIPTFSGRLSVPVYSCLATMRAICGRYDVISYRASGPCVMVALAKLFGVRCVASLHGIDSQREKWGGFASWYLELGERIAAKKADVCLVLSKNMKEYIDNKFGVNSVLFANGIDAPEKLDAREITSRFGLKKDEYILSIGRIVPEKGLHYLIEAFRQCDTQKKLVIAGGAEANSDYYQTLKEQAAGDDRIQFIGFVTGKTVVELYSNAYMFVLPSNLEGMANALLEAMSYGNCCLVSDIPENTEVVTDHAPSFRKSDVENLKEKLQYLLFHPEVVQEYKEHAQSYILERYNWDLVVEQMLSVYSGDVIDYQTVLDRHKIAE